MEPTLPFDFRHSVDLRLDADGHWFHDGQPFLHAGLIALFDRGIDVDPESGEPILRVGDKWCFVRCDDTPFIARSLRLRRDAPAREVAIVLTLNTGAEVVAAPDAFRLGSNGVLYAELGPHRRARLSRSAQATLAPVIDQGQDGGFVLVVGPSRIPVRPLT